MSLAHRSLDTEAERRATSEMWASSAELSTVAPNRTPRIEGGILVIDSCHSIWHFDEKRNRYKRILKGLGADPAVATTQWRSYERLELVKGSDAFVVVLNAEGTRRIRAWRHVEGCSQCVGQTAEYSLEDIRNWGLK